MKVQMLATFIPLLGCSLLIALLALRSTEHLVLSFFSKMLLFLLTIGSCLISIDQFSIAAYIRGFVADLSITTIVMLIAACYSSLFLRAAVKPKERLLGCFLLLAGGVFLYPLALGWGSFDPYQFGYSPTRPGILLSLLILIAIFEEFYLIVTCLLAGLLAYTYRLLDSSNLWDYLIDPLAVLWAIYALTLTLFRQFHKGQPQDG